MKNRGKSTLIDPNLANVDFTGAKRTEKMPIEEGKLLLGLYQTEGKPMAGGLSWVYKAHHTGWQTDMAIKFPKYEMFLTKAQKEMFEAEFENWISLGIHNHIVTCFYLRDIDGVPAIFSEWMNGKSLKEWIYPEDGEECGRLYKGTEKEIHERILDFAIQMSRGLSYAHEHELKLIHRDIKPSNLMLSADGTLKVTDFGLAQARAKIKDNDNESRGWGTPKYFSPEQSIVNNEELTHHTDIWSWAVTILEMFVGDALWPEGTVAGEHCDYYFKKAKIKFPKKMRPLLRHCFQTEISARPKDFREIETRLLEIYQDVTGHTYYRPEPHVATLTADSLNNRALSYLDLNNPDAAEKCWEDALDKDPNSSISRYNQVLHLWQTAQIDDREAIRRMTAVSRKGVNYHYHLAKLCIACSDIDNAIKCINRAINIYGETDDLNRVKAEATEMREKGLEIRHIDTIERPGGRINAVCANQKHIISGSEDGFTTVWDIKTKQFLFNLTGYASMCHWVKSMSSLKPEDAKQMLLDRFGETENIRDGIHRMWYEHTSSVNSVCSNGRNVFSGNSGKMVKVWDFETGDYACMLEEHTGAVRSVCCSRNGAYLISGSDNNELIIWDLTSLEARIYKKHSGGVSAVDISPDNRLILSGSEDFTLKIWDLASGKVLQTMTGHTNPVTSVSFCPNGTNDTNVKRAVSGSSDKSLIVWNIETGERIHTLKGHTDCVTSVCVIGNRVLSASRDRSIRIWNLNTGACLRTLETQIDWVNGISSICCGTDDRTVIFGGGNHIMRWNIPETARYEPLLSRIQSSEKAISESIQFHSIKEKIDQLIQQKDIFSAITEFTKLRDIKSFASGVDFFKIGRKLASYCISEQWHRYVLRAITNIPGHIWDFHFADDHIKALAVRGKTIELWNLTTGKRLHLLTGHTKEVAAARFDPTGKYILSGDFDNNINLWDVKTGNFFMRPFEEHTNCVSSLSFSPNGKYALSGCLDLTARIFEVATGLCISELGKHTEGVRAVCFSPNGQMALSGTQKDVGGTVNVWDVSNIEKPVHLHTFETCSVSDVCFSPDGKLILAGGSLWGEDYIEIWETSTGNRLHSLKGDDMRATSLCFSPDGKLFFSGCKSKKVKVWNLTTGEVVYPLEGFATEIQKVSISPNGQTIIVATNNEIRTYNIDFDFIFPGWKRSDRDKGAYPYISQFLTLHPDYTDDDIDKILLPDLKNRGYGWLLKEGILSEIKKINTQTIKN